MITSTRNTRIRSVRELINRPRQRREANAFIAEGIRLVEEAAQAGWPFRFVLVAQGLGGRARALVNQLQAKAIPVEQVSDAVINSLSETETSQGILAVLEHRLLPIPADPACILIPDQVRDPGNLGTLLRTAAAAGVQAVLLPPETVDAFAPKVVRAGMGAHFRLAIHALDWEAIRGLCASAGLQVMLADMNGPSCWNTDLQQPLALVIGGEAGGASQAARDLAGTRISIPMPGGSESLNAATAGAILLFEMVRQRTANGPR